MKRPHPNRWISLFITLPEWPVKNRLRRFLAFNPFIPSMVSDWSPLKGYEQHRPLRTGDIVVDAGAYPGDYTLFAARQVGPSGRVIAFEPDARNRAVLERNVRLDGRTNVTIIPKGLWDSDDVLNLDQDGLASTVVEHAADSTIEVTTLDAVVAALALPRVDVIKMDIEGAEIRAIQGCVETLRRFAVHACIASYHVVNGETTSHFLEKFFRDQGYTSTSAYPRHLTTYAWKEGAA
jgi:FkbM family methyltransferase